GFTLLFSENSDIVSELLLVHIQLLLPKAPGRCNNVLLQGDQSAAAVATATAASTTALLPTGTAKFLISRNNLQEIDIGHHFLRATQAIVICKRQVVTDKIPRLHHQIFHIDHLV